VLVVEVRGTYLADMLQAHQPAVDAKRLRNLIADGLVRVNGQPCLNNRRLRAGDVVQVPTSHDGTRGPAPTPPRPAAPPELPAVRYESAAVLVVSKPPGLTCVPDRSGLERGLHGLLQRLRPGEDLRIVHRLDRDTSGCLLLAKGIDAARHFDTEFRGHQVQKTYHALVHGVPAASAFAIDAWLGPDPKRPGKVVAGDRERSGFRSAHTDVARERAFGGHALLALRPTTGRSHQLRVHLASVGHPIVGDADYGGEALLLSALKSGYKLRPGVRERPLLGRMFLHAATLSFTDLDGTRVTVDDPMPPDLALVLAKLERFDERRR
jgi:23S rRNA pseudouridine955/2504/2580 synthase